MRLLNLLVATAVSVVVPASAQTAKFPERGQTLRIVVPFAAGGGVDSAARLLSEQLRKQLGMSVIVDNKAGGSGTIGGKAVQIASADGYTLLFSAATHVLANQVLSSPPYDPQTDFAPVARVGEAPLMLVVAPQQKEHKLSDVLAAAKQQQGNWTAAIPAAGAPSHLATLLLAKQGNVKLTYVPYKGTQPALADVAGGHVNMLLDSMISLLPLAKAGKVKPIAITSKQRSCPRARRPDGAGGRSCELHLRVLVRRLGTERNRHGSDRVPQHRDQPGRLGAEPVRCSCQARHRAGDGKPRAVQALRRVRRGPEYRAAEERRLQARVTGSAGGLPV